MSADFPPVSHGRVGGGAASRKLKVLLMKNTQNNALISLVLYVDLF